MELGTQRPLNKLFEARTNPVCANQILALKVSDEFNWRFLPSTTPKTMLAINVVGG